MIINEEIEYSETGEVNFMWCQPVNLMTSDLIGTTSNDESSQPKKNGHECVRLSGGSYLAGITANDGTYIYLGRFASEEDAISTYNAGVAKQLNLKARKYDKEMQSMQDKREYPEVDKS